MKANLVLADGRVFKGKSMGQPGITRGEVVFNTGMTGYEEILTDPAYRGQLVTLTYPLIGNYGINKKDNESYRPHLEGLIVKKKCDYPSHQACKKNIDSYLKEEKVTGIYDIDTRSLTRHIREKGSMFGVIASGEHDLEKLKSQAQKGFEDKRNLVAEVSIKNVKRLKGKGPRIVVIDFGVKYNILRNLNELGAEIIVVPFNTKSEQIKQYNPDAILFSSGPGDPRDLEGILPEIKKLIYQFPVLGICLGHQLLGLAFGGQINKLKFGHHGGNHPVKNMLTDKINITTQNHGYNLKDDLPPELEVTHVNLNDNTIEGIKHRELPVFSVQFHPEAGPGPGDTGKIFNEFLKLIENKRRAKIVNF